MIQKATSFRFPLFSDMMFLVAKTPTICFGESNITRDCIELAYFFLFDANLEVLRVVLAVQILR